MSAVEPIKDQHPDWIVCRGRRRPSFKDWEWFFFLFFTDLGALGLSVLLALAARGILGRFWPGLPAFEGWAQGRYLLTHFWLWTPVFFFFLVYRLYRRFPWWEEVRRLWLALVQGFFFVFALVSLTRAGTYASRLVLGLTLLAALGAFPLWRYLAKRFLFLFSRYRVPVFIYPPSAEAQALAQALDREKTLGYQVAGFLRPESLSKAFSEARFLDPEEEELEFQGGETVFVLLNDLPFGQLQALYRFLQPRVNEIYLVPQFMELGLFNAEIALFFSQRLALIRAAQPVKSYFNRILKRGFDLVGASLLLCFSWPFMLAIALAIKLNSRGPVFFSQDRVGQGGKIFKLYKFRTMYQDAEAQFRAYLERHPEKYRAWLKYRKLKDDPRVTRVGRFLRRFSLDELPQLWNVLKGDMSLVGPRPAMPEEMEGYYREHSDIYMTVRPGLTGLWQVSGRNKLPFKERVKLDAWYVQNWSFWLDLIILFKTLPAVISGEGSY